MKYNHIDEKSKSTFSWWRIYPKPNVLRIDEVYKTCNIDIIVREVMVNSLKEVLPKGRVLDVGCGTGEITINLYDLGYEVTGLDISKEMLEAFKSNAGSRVIPIIFGNVLELEPPVEKFDAVICRYVFTHYPNFALLLKKISEYVKEGGYIVFDSFSKEAVHIASNVFGIPFQELSDKVFSPLASFSKEELQDFCKENGLSLVARHASTFFHRNPLFVAAFPSDIASYDKELREYSNNEHVKRFMLWFHERIAKNLSSNFSGAIVNVIKKVSG